MVYSFHFQRADGVVPDVEYAECGDDAEAMARGERLLASHSDAEAVEVARDGEGVGTARRPWIARLLGGRILGGEARPFVFPG